MKNLIASLSIVFLIFSAAPVLSAEDPIQMLEGVTGRLLIELKDKAQEFEETPDGFYRVVENLVLPHVDFVEMARWVIGRNAWLQANNSQRQTFIDQFKTFMIKNYVKLLLKYTNAEIQFLPLRENIGNQRHIQVSSYMKRSDHSVVSIDYHLILQDGKWKVYDMLIEGSSLLEGYQAQFSQDIERGGIELITEKIVKENAE